MKSPTDSPPPFHVGQLLCGGFQGVTVTPQAYHLIVQHHVSTMILLRKNAASVKQMTKLIRDLQHIAYNQGKYEYPLIFAIDEEGGMMNSLFDDKFLSQFPGAMALAATGDTELVYNISKALAMELKFIGFSVILGPVLDVITKLSHQLVGVRSFGTTLEEVTKFGKACAKGLKDGGLLTVGKHFPGIGNASVDSLLELPMMADSLDQIKHFNSVPFAELIKEGLLDGISAAGCGVPSISPDETHACLSPIVINQLLRQELGFKGFVISECLEMDALYHSIGLGQGVILAIYAGCDLVMVCHDLALQNEAVESMEKAIANGNLDEEIIMKCIERIDTIRKQLPKWEEILPKNLQVPNNKINNIELFKYQFPELWQQHQELSKNAYRKSITLVRDYTGTLPLTKFLTGNNNNVTSKTINGNNNATGDDDDNNLLILSPLLAPIYPDNNSKKKSKINHVDTQLYTGEEVFQKFGELLSNYPINDKKSYNVLHTTYTANGLTALHESLIENSKVVIVLTSEASRNMYQIGIVKYVSILCGANPSSFTSGTSILNLQKPLVIIATLSPYDFFYNKNIGSAYLCCYDYTNNVLEELVSILMGDSTAEGCIPGEKKFVGNRSKKRKLAAAAAAAAAQAQAQGSGQGQAQGRLTSSSSFNFNLSRSIKKITQPKRRWLVDEFNMQRDWSSLVKLWKNNGGGYDENFGVQKNINNQINKRRDKINYEDDEFFKKLGVLLSTTSKVQKHFVVRNSSLNILYGIILTWVDEYQNISLNGNLDDECEENKNGKIGSIIYLLVDKLKRLQSIGKNLHARAIRCLIKEQGCSKIELGTSFPILTMMENTNLNNNNRIVQTFMNNVGWGINDNQTFSNKKHIMILNELINWSVPKKIFRELMIVGVRFDICTHAEKLMKLIEKTTESKREGDEENDKISDEEKNRIQRDNIRIKQLYMEAIKYLSSKSSYEVKIIIALEPTNQNVIGSIIIFTNKSQLSKFYPFMDEASRGNNINEMNVNSNSNRLVGGIIEPVIDPSYSNLTEIFKFGLICSGITYLKSNFGEESGNDIMNQCLIFGIDEDKSINGVKEIGFNEWKQYNDYYDVKTNAGQVFLGESKV